MRSEKDSCCNFFLPFLVREEKNKIKWLNMLLLLFIFFIILHIRISSPYMDKHYNKKNAKEQQEAEHSVQ